MQEFCKVHSQFSRYTVVLQRVVEAVLDFFVLWELKLVLADIEVVSSFFWLVM